MIVVDDGTTSYITEYAINQTVTNLGDFGASISGDYTTLTAYTVDGIKLVLTPEND